MDEMSNVYVLTDNENRITAVNSGEFIEDIASWKEIERGYGDKYYHAQGNYFPKMLLTAEGVWRYKLVDGKAVERTSEEIAADIAAMPKPEPIEDPEEIIDILTGEVE